MIGFLIFITAIGAILGGLRLRAFVLAPGVLLGGAGAAAAGFLSGEDARLILLSVAGGIALLQVGYVAAWLLPLRKHPLLLDEASSPDREASYQPSS
jgi:hypothetical protein